MSVRPTKNFTLLHSDMLIDHEKAINMSMSLPRKKAALGVRFISKFCKLYLSINSKLFTQECDKSIPTFLARVFHVYKHIMIADKQLAFQCRYTFPLQVSHEGLRTLSVLRRLGSKSSRDSAGEEEEGSSEDDASAKDRVDDGGKAELRLFGTLEVRS